MKAPRQSGFTLWELLITMLVAGLLLAIGVPSFRDAQRNSAITAAANDLITGLLAARAEAVKRQVPVTLCASPDPSAANPVCAQDGAGANGGFIVWVDWDPAHVDRAHRQPDLYRDRRQRRRRQQRDHSDPHSGSAERGAERHAERLRGDDDRRQRELGLCELRPERLPAHGGGRRVRAGDVAFSTATTAARTQTFGANFSTARLVRIEATGRANVEQALQDINGAGGALSQIPGAVCP